jgi:hypothetical protein
MAHPLDAPDLARRLRVVRTLCRGAILGVAGLNTAVGLIVWHVLGGVPLAGNMVRLGGVSAATVVAGVLAAAAPGVALAVSAGRVRAGLRELPAPDSDGLVGVFAAATFAEYAVVAGLGFACAALLHLTADPLMFAWVGWLLAFLVVRFPTTRRARAWYDRWGSGRGPVISDQ